MTGKMAMPEPEVVERELKIIALRNTGATWEAIARALNYAGPSGAYKAYQRAQERRVHPKIDEHRDLELAFLDSLLHQLFFTEDGKPKAKLTLSEMDRALAVHDRKAKLLGLNAPEKLQTEVITYDGNTLAEHTQRIIELVRSSRSTTSALGGNFGETGATA
jgi:hypothetical protein